MQRSFLLKALLLLAFVLFTSSPVTAAVQWYADISQALAAQKQSQRPIFIYFRLARAIPCQQFEAGTMHNQQVLGALEQKFVCMYVNVDSSQELAQRFGIFQVPTTIMLDLNGKEFQRLVTGYPPDKMMEILQNIDNQMAESARQVDPSAEMNQRAAQSIFHESFDSLYGWGNDGSSASTLVRLALVKGVQGNAFKVDYEIMPKDWSYIQFNRPLLPEEHFELPKKYTVVFQFAGKGGANKVDFKLIDGNGTNYGASIKVPTDFKGHQYVLTSEDIGYLWGGDKVLSDVMSIQIAVTPDPETKDTVGITPIGTVYLDELLILPGEGWNIPGETLPKVGK